jgi:pre-mRNA-splicing factor 38B
VGVLYVRYVVAPADMWSFLGPKLSDQTEFDYNMSGRKTKMGDWVRGLIDNIHYHDTILPRIPVPAQH